LASTLRSALAGRARMEWNPSTIRITIARRLLSARLVLEVPLVVPSWDHAVAARGRSSLFAKAANGFARDSLSEIGHESSQNRRLVLKMRA
jgi:hypothetical protein